MSKKKNIDQLFKERFKNFEAAPSPQVWENIQAQLQAQKKERRVIPLWWQVAGVAALLALLFTVGNAVFNPFGVGAEHQLVDEDVDAKKDAMEVIDENLIVPQNKNTVIASETEDTAEAFETNSENEKQSFEETKQNTFRKQQINRSEIASEEHKKNTNASKQQHFKEVQNIGISKKEAVAISVETKNVAPSIIKESLDPRIVTNVETNTKESKVTTADVINEKKVSEEKEVIPSTTKEAVVVAETTTTKEDPKKKSIFDEIEATETAVASSQTNKTLDNRWQVSPSVAPVYYSSLGEGSSIDPSFSDNNQSGDINFSYGVKVSYQINERLKLRSGISNVDLSYATGGIELATGPVSQALRSINYDGGTRVTTAIDRGSIAANTTNPNNPFGDLTPKSATGNVELVQNLSYYEVPMELSYALVNKRVGINILGGMSTLFLGNNEVSVVADNLNETLGEANNLSSVSFSTNIGLGFDYKLSKKFTFNIEPMFKYQLNPYTDSSVDFKPYYMGVYTGFSLTF